MTNPWFWSPSANSSTVYRNQYLNFIVGTASAKRTNSSRS